MKNGNGNGNARAHTRAQPTLDELVGMCMEVYEAAGKSERVYVNKNGEQCVVPQPEYRSQLQAVDLMAKLLGYLGTEGGKVDVDQLRRMLRANGFDLVPRATA